MHGALDFRESFIAWLTGEGAFIKSIPHLVDSYCRCVRALGYGVRRCNLATDTVHPQMTGTRHVWFSEAVDPGPINPAVVVLRRQFHIEGALIDEVYFNSGSQQNPQFLASPFFRVEEDGELYAEIAPSGSDQAFPVFHDLAAIGCTAYFGLRLNGFAGIKQKISLALDNPGGLTAGQISDLRWSLQLFTLLLNTLIEYDIKNTLARVYLGRDPGGRVCAGMIERGNVVEIEGAIWFSDVRGFTAMSEELPPSELIAALNTYYQLVVRAIYARGGEVLKYIGDAVLAIFPSRSFPDDRSACAAAYEAAIAARQALKEAGSLEDWVALHYGVAQYGNVGSEERLDFTLIGREVNLAARLKPISDNVGESIVCTRAFQERIGRDMRALGRFEAKGLREPVELFAP